MLTSHHYTFIDKLLSESFKTTVGISRVGMAHPDFFQGGRLPTLPPKCWRPWQRNSPMVSEHRHRDVNHMALWWWTMGQHTTVGTVMDNGGAPPSGPQPCGFVTVNNDW